MGNDVRIRAFFKQATVKGGTATLQFEVLTDNASAFTAIKKSGKYVILTLGGHAAVHRLRRGDGGGLE